MRLSISNIAWSTDNDEHVAEILNARNVDAIDIAHPKYFAAPDQATSQQIKDVKQWWKSRGIDIVGMQALLFGTQDLNVFGDAQTQQTMLDHLNHVCRIGGELDATRLVFGSPKNRDRQGLSDQETDAISTEFFGRLGDIAASHGVIICLEPNPEEYGANFMTTSLETKQVVQRLNHPSIKMQLDTGALSMNGEDPTVIIEQCADQIGHIHISEPLLAPINAQNPLHTPAASKLKEIAPDSIITIEMKATDTEIDTVTEAVDTVQSIYIQ